MDEKLAQVSCYFPLDINDTVDFTKRFPRGVGEVSCLEVRSARTLNEVTSSQRRIQEETIAASRLGIPAIFRMDGTCGACLPGATSFPSGLGRGASWDDELERAIAEVVGRQERAVGITCPERANGRADGAALLRRSLRVEVRRQGLHLLILADIRHSDRLMDKGQAQRFRTPIG